MRLFVGMPLAPASFSELSAVVARLRSSADGLRWMEAESWHITLQFLGNTSPKQYECLISRLAEVHSRPVSVQLGQVGFFDRAGVLFVDVSPTPDLVTLAGRVVDATSLCGFVPETRSYHPHITLARVKGRGQTGPGTQPIQSLRQKVNSPHAFSRFKATEFLLYESHLSPAGSSYEIRRRFPLAGMAQ